MLDKDFSFGQIHAVCAVCPECNAPVLSYAPYRVSPGQKGTEDIWVLTCDRCGAVFDVRGDELLLPSIPLSWLVSKPDDWAN